jgi:hypothetical protein
VVFHVHNDYVRQQAQPFRIRKRVADRQNPGTIPKRLQRLFLQLLIHIGERLRNSMNFHMVERVIKSLLDALIVAIHTGWYLGGTQESET